MLYAEGEKASINLADPSIFAGIIVTDDHGFKDVCYMSGKTGNYDSSERLRAFMGVEYQDCFDIDECNTF